jgi:hypothetical protein
MRVLFMLSLPSETDKELREDEGGHDERRERKGEEMSCGSYFDPTSLENEE